MKGLCFGEGKGRDHEDQKEKPKKQRRERRENNWKRDLAEGKRKRRCDCMRKGVGSKGEDVKGDVKEKGEGGSLAKNLGDVSLSIFSKGGTLLQRERGCRASAEDQSQGDERPPPSKRPFLMQFTHSLEMCPEIKEPSCSSGGDRKETQCFPGPFWLTESGGVCFSLKLMVEAGWE